MFTYFSNNITGRTLREPCQNILRTFHIGCTHSPLSLHLFVSDSKITWPETALTWTPQTPVTFRWSALATWGEVKPRGRRLASQKSHLNDAHHNSITHEHHPGTHLHPLVDLIRVSGIVSKTFSHTHMQTQTQEGLISLISKLRNWERIFETWCEAPFLYCFLILMRMGHDYGMRVHLKNKSALKMKKPRQQPCRTLPLPLRFSTPILLFVPIKKAY